MFNKKIFVTKHCLQRFEERGIRISQKRNTIIKQIITDLRPLNVRKIIRLPKKNEIKIITKHGKVYIGVETRTKFIIKTVFTESLTKGGNVFEIKYN